MTRRRFVGVLFVALTLAVSSLVLAQSKKQVDINTASEEEMVAVGIEKAAAKKIVEARPYRNKTELVSRQLLTRTQYDKIKDSLVARQSMTSKASEKPAGK
jgi:DNA uptake protein ComE-like DNA-binding protein